MPFGAHFLDRTVLRPTNEKATSDLGWLPEHRTYRDGIRHWAEAAGGLGSEAAAPREWRRRTGAHR